MNLDQLLAAIVSGVFLLGVLSILFAPNSPLASVISQSGQALGNLVVQAKSYPK